MKYATTFLLSCILAIALVLPAAAAPAAVFPDVIPLPDGWRPEGITSGTGTTAYVGSLGTGAIYQVDLRTGDGSVAVPPQEGRVSVGLDYDQRSNYIFAAGGGSGAAYVYDVATGATVGVFQFTTESSFINDVIVTNDAAYFTDSQSAVIYKIPLGPGGALPADGSFVEIALGGDFELVNGFNANGIEATANGKALIIVQSAIGALYNVDPTTGNATLIDLNGGSVPNGDGLLLVGKTLYVVQNQNNQVAVVDLNAKLTAGTVSELLTDSDFDVPTTVIGFGKALYAVNARFGIANPNTAEYDIVRVEK
ncbi:MAG TPA: hypothetical protein P5121_24530 [Caldilineaceae bacterium]|nr:hypothetical protein [Caldilineaceae bacterium]